jgi:murein L,D-transpeptidase YafK
MDRRLDRAKKDVFDICTEAKRMADATMQTIQQSPILSFEKQWKKDNETLIRRSEEGRRASS